MIRHPFITFTWKNIFIIFIWIIIWLKLFDLVSLKITGKWQAFFSYYEGYRLPASVAAFVPFTKQTLQADPAYTIIFTGDSTSGGFLYHHSQAIPAYLNQTLNAQGKPIHTYNLAFSGAHLTEQYLLMKEMIPDADRIVFPLHYSFFMGRGINNSFISHPELVDFLESVTPDDVSLVGLRPPAMPEKIFGKILGNIWYTYQVHRLLPYITLGKPVKFWLRDQVNAYVSLNSPSGQKPLVIDPLVAFNKQTLEVQSEILKQNQFLWQRMQPLDETNVSMQYLVKIGRLKAQTDKPILAYFVPLDFSTLNNIGVFDKITYAQNIGYAKKVLSEWSIPFLDFNEGNPAQLTRDDFYNPDHLLPEGNRKVAEVLAEWILHDF